MFLLLASRCPFLLTLLSQFPNTSVEEILEHLPNIKVIKQNEFHIKDMLFLASSNGLVSQFIFKYIWTFVFKSY